MILRSSLRVRVLMRRVFLLLLVTGFCAGLRADEGVDFQRDVRPVLAKNCLACHGPDEKHREGGLRLDTFAGATGKLDSGEVAVTPGNLEKSELWQRITSTDEAIRMPPAKTGPGLNRTQLDAIKKWIQSGGEYREHWAFVPPVRSPLLRVRMQDWPLNEVDYFVLSELERNRLKPAPRADRHTLIRRLSLDLRGLPPTPEEIAKFINDPSEGAYEAVVDRLLNDPAFGEKWARMWLDLARYADSRGFGSDPLRPNIWRYRDWVIEAFNTNMPFDQFTREQLAGDLLPEPKLSQLVATAFNRNTMTNTEGGTDDEEFRVAAVKDRSEVTFQVWMGLTMGCAQCHTHKYDPITQKEYYQFSAFFNQTADFDQPDERPTIAAPTPEMDRQNGVIDKQITERRTKLATSTPELEASQKKWEEGLRLTTDWREVPVQAKVETQKVEAKKDEKETEKQIWTLTAGEIGIPEIQALRVGVSNEAKGFEKGLLTVKWKGEELKPKGQFVRIELPGRGKMIHLAEVQVFSGKENIALKGVAKQSSTAGGEASRAIDGNTNGDFEKGSVTHTGTEENPWWEVDLGKVQTLDRVVIWNRTSVSEEITNRLAGFKLLVLDEKRNVVWEKSGIAAPKVDVEETLAPLPHRLIELSSVRGGGTKNIAVKSVTWALGEKVKGMEGPASLRWELPSGVVLKAEEIKLWVSGAESYRRRSDVTDDMLKVVDQPVEKRSKEEAGTLGQYYRDLAPELEGVRKEIAALDKSRPTPPMLPVMQELPLEKRRKSHVMIKGNFLMPGDEVEAVVPASFNPWSEALPRNRLGVAEWILDKRNPLTARVMVNRLWGQIFGRGLVLSEEDFGTQGELPTHPELLDWLAVRFRDGDAKTGIKPWDVKGILRVMLLSETYRQDSKVTAESLAKDPMNRLLSRGERHRLEAEMVRDQTLALSGLLSKKQGGPSVFPYQPEGLWQAAFNGERTWSTSAGDDRYRRGLYVFWRRTVPYPSMAAFDAPSREICALRRPRTNTPLQAFVTLNDPVYVEGAQALGRRILLEGGKTTWERARFGLELCLTRPATEGEVKALVELHDQEAAHYTEFPHAGYSLATEPRGELPEGMDVVEAAAWTVVGNVLLNHDGVLTRN